MDYFTVDEIVWGKIKGYPWWPAMITEIEEDNKEKKYKVNFIGNNRHANLKKRNIGKFEKEFKNHSNTKKKDLLESIKTASDLFYNKKVNSTTIIKEIAIIKNEINAVINVRIILPNFVVSKFSKMISSGSGAEETDSPFSFSHLFLSSLLKRQ